MSSTPNSDETPNPLPATFLRGGTSKGIFLNRALLPADRAKWDPIFLGIMGSPDPEHARQLNGMGGGISSLSKICVVGAPTPAQREAGIAAEYTFAQVGVRDARVDYSGNCGNLSSMIGVFAVDEGICAPTPGTHATVRAFNTNTQKVIDTAFPLASTDPPTADLGRPETAMAGVPGRASAITLAFLRPAGARTGTLLPTGAPVDVLSFHMPTGGNSSSGAAAPAPKTVRASCVDATNPTVFVAHAELSAVLPLAEYLRGQLPAVGDALEAIRQAAALKMGLDPAAQAQPKICVLSAPPPSHPDAGAGTGAGIGSGIGASTGEAETGKAGGADIAVHALSMGVLHKAVPMTVGLCLGVAAGVEGTLPWEIVRRARAARARPAPPPGSDAGSGASEGMGEGESGGTGAGGTGAGMVRISHPGGLVDVGAEFGPDGSVASARVVRTGRRLMKGVVWW